MTTNMGPADRTIRAVVGLALLSLVFFLDGPNRWWGLVGIVPLATSAIGWCPAYLPFGFSTRKREGGGKPA